MRIKIPKEIVLDNGYKVIINLGINILKGLKAEALEIIELEIYKDNVQVARRSMTPAEIIPKEMMDAFNAYSTKTTK